MDSVESVEKEIDKVLSKFVEAKCNTAASIDDVISIFTVVLNSLRGTSDPTSPMTTEQINDLRKIITRCKSKLLKIGSEHRNMHSSVSKIGKQIDRHFMTDYETIAPLDLFNSQKFIGTLNQVIAEHFNRQGLTDVAESLVAESQLTQEQDIHLELFADLYQMWESITNKELGPALEWVTQYSSELNVRRSNLEFKLHRLAYLQLLEKGISAQNDAINYSRTHFNKFMGRYDSQIQMLMGCLIYVPMGFKNTPYSHLFTNDMWVDAADSFLRESCEIISVNKDSCLEIIVNSGCYALPALMNIKQIMVKNHVSGVWSGRHELPIEIDLGNELRYHSIFTCPILRQPSTEENPPMKLKCGHIISKDAMHKLVRGLMLKCPYCPKESTLSDTKRIHF